MGLVLRRCVVRSTVGGYMFIFMLAGSYAAQGFAQPRSNVPSSPQSTSSQAPGPLSRSGFIRDMENDFAKMDADKNQQLTALEVERWQSAAQLESFKRRNRMIFSNLDVDRNGQISPSEFAALVPRTAPSNGRPMVAQMDKNNDTQISLIEYRRATVMNFDRLDTDTNGVVTQAEMRAGGIGK